MRIFAVILETQRQPRPTYPHNSQSFFQGARQNQDAGWPISALCCVRVSVNGRETIQGKFAISGRALLQRARDRGRTLQWPCSTRNLEWRSGKVPERTDPDHAVRQERKVICLHRRRARELRAQAGALAASRQSER